MGATLVRISEGSDILVLVRAIATALVAAVIGNLIIFPSGALAETPLLLRIAAVLAGFLAYLGSRRIIIGIFFAEASLLAGMLV